MKGPPDDENLGIEWGHNCRAIRVHCHWDSWFTEKVEGGDNDKFWSPYAPIRHNEPDCVGRELDCARPAKDDVIAIVFSSVETQKIYLVNKTCLW